MSTDNSDEQIAKPNELAKLIETMPVMDLEVWE
jgi:hypothetical protein